MNTNEIIRRAMINHLIHLLLKHKGNIIKCAKELGVDDKNFYRMCEKYNVNYENYLPEVKSLS